MWILVLAMLCIMQEALFAFTPHIQELQHVPSPIKKYRLVDLGETNITITKLSRLQQGFSYAPAINNRSQITWNTLEGGVVKSLRDSGESFIPRFEGMKLYVMGLNENGDLLIAIERGFDSTEWMLWPHNGSEYGAREHIHTFDPFSPDLILTSFNRDEQVVGFTKDGQGFIPIIWTRFEGIQPMEKVSGVVVPGKARGNNGKNSIVGLYEEMKVFTPFIWSPHSGFEVMRNYRDKLFPVGWMEFSDILISEDDIVYGNYWLKHGSHEEMVKGSTYHYGFMWTPRESKIEQMDLEGMRLAAINEQHTLAGSWHGRAAMREKGRRPVALETLMSFEELLNWELCEATAINDQGQIVGYGTYKGKTHIFLAEPL